MVAPEVALEFRVLGPVEIWHTGAQVEIGASRQRDLLALLLTKPGGEVGRDRLIEALWNGAPPPAAKTTLQSCVYRLRKVFEPHPEIALLTRGHGYVLEIPPLAVDAQRFEHLVGLGLGALSTNRAEAISHLRAAMALWRGDAFADVSVHAIRECARRLDDRRLEVTEQCLAVELELGHAIAVLGELKTMVAAHPLRERPSELLMEAQYRVARRAEALYTYQSLFRRLGRELGVRPSQSARDLHRRILADTPDPDPQPRRSHEDPQFTTSRAQPPLTMSFQKPPVFPQTFDAPVPRQLPSGVGDFVGRAETLKSLGALLDDYSDTGVVAVVSGAPGVGKTTLAVHLAWRVMDRFPDGQLYVDLRGFDQSGRAMDPSEAVRGFLAALGVIPERIPADLDAQVGLYRSLVAGKRILLLLDNARDAAQVRTLLPGSEASGCLALVTSRGELTGLIASKGAHSFVLQPLGSDDAQRLLERRLGSERVAAEPDVVTDVLAHCAGLPLAIAIVAARATTHPDFLLETVAADLRVSRGLDAFESSDSAADVRTVFSWSYQRLSPSAARLFRLLALHPGPDIGRSAAASMAAVPERAVQQHLAELDDARLVTETERGRYGLHDLLRAYATELAEADETYAERRAAVLRVLDHYLQEATMAAGQSAPYGWGPAMTTVHPRADPRPFVDSHITDLDGAAAWFERERSVLVQVVEAASRMGFVHEACGIAWHVGKFFDRRGYWHDYADLQAMLLAAADQLGDPVLLSYENAAYGRAVVRLDKTAEARRHLDRAYELCSQIGDVLGQVRIRRTMAWIAEREADYPTAFAATKEAVDLCRTVTDSAIREAGSAELLSALGWCHALLGEYESALACCRLAVPVLQDHAYVDAEAHGWDTMGYAHHQLGQFTEALDCYQRALPILRQLGDAFAQADTLNRIAVTYTAIGAVAQATAARSEALGIVGRLRSSDADRLRAKLVSRTQSQKSTSTHSCRCSAAQPQPGSRRSTPSASHTRE